MPRKKETEYKIAKRVLPNKKLSSEYYAQIRNEFDKRVWVKLGTNQKEASKNLKAELLRISQYKITHNLDKKSKNYNKKPFLTYLIENHYFEPEKNIQYVFFKDTGKESYGLNHSKLVANYLHRLFDENKSNDPLGAIPYKQINHKDALDLWIRLKDSTEFKTSSVSVYNAVNG